MWQITDKANVPTHRKLHFVLTHQWSKFSELNNMSIQSVILVNKQVQDKFGGREKVSTTTFHLQYLKLWKILILKFN